jgi:hypothetical protein
MVTTALHMCEYADHEEQALTAESETISVNHFPHSHDIRARFLLPLLEKITHSLQLPLDHSNMLLTPWSKPHLEWFRSRNQLLLVRLRIYLNLLSRVLVDRVLNAKGPQQPRQNTPLCTLSEVNTSAYAAASTVSVVVAFLVI